jgi:hypothetical protein
MRFILLFLSCLACLGNNISSVWADEKDIAVSTSQNLWISGKLPRDSVSSGPWQWSESFTHDGINTHVQFALQGLSRYSFRTQHRVKVDSNSKILQYVYLDPEKAPEGIMLRFLLNASDELAVYWEGKEEVFSELDEYITAWYMGFIPGKGNWILLSIDLKELDIKQAFIEGMEFIISTGRVWWGETIISE